MTTIHTMGLVLWASWPILFGALVVFAFAIGLVRYAENKAGAMSFINAFLPFTSDVDAAEHSLPELRDTYRGEAS